MRIRAENKNDDENKDGDVDEQKQAMQSRACWAELRRRKDSTAKQKHSRGNISEEKRRNT